MRRVVLLITATTITAVMTMATALAQEARVGSVEAKVADFTELTPCPPVPTDGVVFQRVPGGPGEEARNCFSEFEIDPDGVPFGCICCDIYVPCLLSDPEGGEGFCFDRSQCDCQGLLSGATSVQ